MVEKNIRFNLNPDDLAEFKAYMLRMASDIPGIEAQLDEFERQVQLAEYEATNFTALRHLLPSSTDVPISGDLTGLLLALEASKENKPAR